MVQIVPTILSTNEEDFKRDLEKILNSESFKQGWVHIDFMDNKFVPNKSIDPSVVAKYNISLNKEAHAMVEHPLEWVEKLVNAGFNRVIFHLEAKDDTLKTIQAIKDGGMEVGIAINIETPIDELEPFAKEIDSILVMGVVPGFQGQPFLPESINRINEVSRLRSKKNLNLVVAVDGAVSDKNAKQLVEAGVDQLSVGSFLLKGDVDENVEKIWEGLQPD